MPELSPEVKAVLYVILVAAGAFLRDVLSAGGRRIQADANEEAQKSEAEGKKALAEVELQLQAEKLKLAAQSMIQDEVRNLRDLIDHLNTDAGVQDDRIAALTVQQEKNIKTIQELEEKAKLRHEELNERTAREIARETALNETIQDLQRDLQRAKQELMDCISSIKDNETKTGAGKK